MWEDPIVTEVRRLRQEYAAAANYDMARIFARLRLAEQEPGRPTVSYVHCTTQPTSGPGVRPAGFVENPVTLYPTDDGPKRGKKGKKKQPAS